ncbi:MAG: hypothetical protein OET90_06955 [Desulfuromonadales bacterium]|nr:hypothetical protein [Desulfuromonadales bacterium]
MKKKSCLLLALCFVMVAALCTLASASDLFPDGLGDVAGGEALHYQVGEVAVSIDTSASVRTILEGDSDLVNLSVESLSGPASASYTISGLAEQTTYYLYVDDLHSGQEVTTDTFGQLTWTQNLDEPHLIIIKKNPSTYFISATEWTDGNGVLHPAGWSYSDGTDLNGITGTWDAETLTATLLMDLDEQIQIMSDSIVLDGAGHALNYTSSASGSRAVYVSSARDTEIKNLAINDWSTSVYLYYAYGATITDCEFKGNGYHVFANRSGGHDVINNTFDGGTAVRIYPFTWGGNVTGNEMISGSTFVYTNGLTGSVSYLDNYINVRNQAFYFYNSSYNVLTGNTIVAADTGVMIQGGGTYRSRYNRTVNNNFIDVQKPIVEHGGVYNTYSEPLPVGGNHYSDWTSPDADSDGVVDNPRPIYDYYGNLTDSSDDLPFVRKNGWILNQPPVFATVAPVEVDEYDQVSIPLSVSDPENDPIVLVYAENMPARATFDSETLQFDWRPVGDQAGVHIVSFYAVDGGDPAATGRLDVIVTVGDATSPTKVNEALAEELLLLALPFEIENSYLANLKKADDMIEKGNITAVINQYQTFIHKVEQDLQHDAVEQSVADTLTLMANDAINLLNP